MVGLFALLIRFFLIMLIPGIIAGVVLIIVFATRSGKKNPPPQQQEAPVAPPVAQPAPQYVPQPAPQPVAPAPQAPANTKIFIDGGQPAYGDNLGKITVNGKTLAVLYSQLPIEINLPAGNHHVVVEGGHVGDARVDRFIQLGAEDVWTVDLPGGNDADLIRHQIIHISEYRKAIATANYQVNKKYF